MKARFRRIALIIAVLLLLAITPFAIKVWRYQSHANRGFAALNDGDDDRAISEFTQALEVGPRMANAYDGRGYAWLGKHDYQAAIADFNEAIRFDPKNAQTYENRGIAHFNKWCRETNQTFVATTPAACGFAGRGRLRRAQLATDLSAAGR